MIRALDELRALRQVPRDGLEPLPLPSRVTTAIRTVVTLAGMVPLLATGTMPLEEPGTTRWFLGLSCAIPLLGVAQLFIYLLSRPRDRARVEVALPVYVRLPGWRLWAQRDDVVLLARRTSLVCLFRHDGTEEQALDKLDPARELEIAETPTNGRYDLEAAGVVGFVRRLAGTAVIAVVLADDEETANDIDDYLTYSLPRAPTQPRQVFRVVAAPSIAAARVLS